MVEISAVSYLQSCRTICLGSPNGIRVIQCCVEGPSLLYSTPKVKNCDVFLLVHEPGGKKVLLVTRNRLRCLKVFNLVEPTSQRELEFVDNITAVETNSLVIVVKVSSRLHLLDSETLTTLGDVIRDVDSNSPALAIAEGIVAFPRTEIGHVGISTLDLERKLLSFECFGDWIAALEFSQNGFYLAVAAESGKFIRVFSVHSGTRCFEFVSDLPNHIQITSMSFHNDEYFVVASNSDSVQVFPLKPFIPEMSIWDTLSQFVMKYIGWSNDSSGQWSIFTLKLPCGVSYDNKVFMTSSCRGMTLHVGSSSGWIYECCLNGRMRMTGFFSWFLGSEEFWEEKEALSDSFLN